MAFVTLDTNGNITGIFGIAQNPPTPPGYAEIADTDPRIAAFQAAQAAALTPRPTPRAWLERLSPTTQQAIFAGAMGNATLLAWLFKAAGTSDGIDVNAAETKSGVAAMQAANLISAAEAATLLAP